MSKPARRDPPPPMEGDDRVITVTVTGGWAAALVAVLVLTGLGVLPGRDRWWDWTCALGFAMGLFGLWYVPRLKRARARAEQRRTEARRAAGTNQPSTASTDQADLPEPVLSGSGAGSHCTPRGSPGPGRLRRKRLSRGRAARRWSPRPRLPACRRGHSRARR